jgi:hypothetical protein
MTALILKWRGILLSGAPNFRREIYRSIGEFGLINAPFDEFEDFGGHYLRS